MVLLLALVAAIHVPLPQGFRPATLVTADFNTDGKVDVAICGENQQLVVFLGDGHGGMRSLAQNATCGKAPSDMIAVDLNRDRKPDLAIANHDTDYLTVLTNGGQGHFSARQVHVHSNPHPHTVAAGDFDEDGHIDLITDSWGENRLTLVLADGKGGWRSPGTPVEVGRKPYMNVVAADLDGDGHVDLAMPNYGAGTVGLFFGDGHGHFTAAPQSPIAAGPTPFWVTVADVNADGRLDIVVANYSGQSTDSARDGVTWIRNDGKRRFTAFPERIASGHYTARIAAGDLDGDHVTDIAFTSTNDGTIALVYGAKTGLRPGPSLPSLPSAHALAVADLDGDGRAEVLAIAPDRDELLIVKVR